MVVIIGATLIVVVGISRPVDIVELVFSVEAMSVVMTMLTFVVLVASRVLERSSEDTLVTISAVFTVRVRVLVIGVAVAVLITVVIAGLLMSISTVAQNWRLVEITRSRGGPEQPRDGWEQRGGRVPHGQLSHEGSCDTWGWRVGRGLHGGQQPHGEREYRAGRASHGQLLHEGSRDAQGPRGERWCEKHRAKRACDDEETRGEDNTHGRDHRYSPSLGRGYYPQGRPG